MEVPHLGNFGVYQSVRCRITDEGTRFSVPLYLKSRSVWEISGTGIGFSPGTFVFPYQFRYTNTPCPYFVCMPWLCVILQLTKSLIETLPSFSVTAVTYATVISVLTL
jgi:hypothetical protein